jgi:hypothetical protein
LSNCATHSGDTKNRACSCEPRSRPGAGAPRHYAAQIRCLC